MEQGGLDIRVDLRQHRDLLHLGGQGDRDVGFYSENYMTVFIAERSMTHVTNNFVDTGYTINVSTSDVDTL